MLGSDSLEVNCLEMICADFLAGASLVEPRRKNLTMQGSLEFDAGVEAQQKSTGFRRVMQFLRRKVLDPEMAGAVKTLRFPAEFAGHHIETEEPTRGDVAHNLITLRCEVSRGPPQNASLGKRFESRV